MSNEKRDECKKKQKVMEEIEELQRKKIIVVNAEEIEELEKEIQGLMDRLGACILEQKVQESLESREMQDEEAGLIKNHPKRWKSEGMREVSVKTSFGVEIELQTRYYRQKGQRKRGRRYKGMYAGLIMLGIYEHCTPRLTSEISQMVVLLGSFTEAEGVLKERGHSLCVNTLREIAYRAAERARMVQKVQGYLGDTQESVKGRRVVVSSDGGRIRLREKKRGRKTEKGRSRYTGAWREPKLFIIYVVDENGRHCKSFAPFIDGTMNGPDSLFAMLAGYLEKLDIMEADKIVFVSDGAKWIWKRLPNLITSLNLDKNKVHLLIDFYHAVEHLNRVASLCKGWSSRQRKQWLNKNTKLLKNGDVETVIENVSVLCRGRNSRSIRTQLNYFTNHQEHMKYSLVSSLGLPIGSGAIESAIRRVVNLRLKGCSLFWSKQSAESMLFLRAFSKSGRWSLFKSLTFSPAFSLSF